MIEYFIDEIVMYSLYWVIIGAWRALPIAMIVFGIDLLMRKRLAARFHCLLWTLVLVRLLCPVSVSSSVSMHGPIDRLTEYAFSDAEAATSQVERVSQRPEDVTTGQQSDAYVNVAAHGTTLLPDPTPYNIKSETGTASDWETWLAYGIVIIWLAVALGILIRGAVQYLQFASRIRRCPEVTGQPIIDQVLRACDQVGVGHRPRLREVDGLTVPAVFGLFRHTICLPPGTTSDLPADQLRWVLMHEIAHIKRRDSLLLSVAIFMRAWHWFNPLAWLLVSRMRHHMEHAADDIATRGTSDDGLTDYGRLLLKYATDSADVRQPATMGLLFVSARKHLQQRIEMLGQNQGRNRWTAKTMAILIVSAVAVTGLTDAKSLESAPRQKDRVPSFHILDTAQISVGNESLVEPNITVTYDVRGVLSKLKETVPKMDPDVYVTSHFNQFKPGAAQLMDGDLTVVQTAAEHRETRALLHAWERSGGWQVCIECLVITTNLQYLSGIDWTRLGVIPGTNRQESAARAFASRTGDLSDIFLPDAPSELTIETQDASVQSCPSVAVKISNADAMALRDRCQADSHSNIMFATKVTIFNGQFASIRDEVLRPFVTGVRPIAKIEGSLEPIVEVISEGYRIDFHAEVTEDDDDVDLQCIVGASHIQSVDLAILPFLLDHDPTRNATVQVPNVSRSSVRACVRLTIGESLLIIFPATFDSEAAGENATATCYVLTPRPIPESVVFSDSAQNEP